MRRIVINVPEKILLAEKTDEAAFARELRMLAAAKLYELGRLSSGRAAELAGMPRIEFLLALGRYKVFPFEAELRDLPCVRVHTRRLGGLSYRRTASRKRSIPVRF
jgi:predicted HTH domain antitoxin